MRPNSRELAMRDPAAAALFGLLGDSDFGAEFGAEFGDDDEFAGEVGDDFGDDDIGSEMKRPSQAQLISLWKNSMARRNASTRRVALLDPNRGSQAKVEKYVFSLSEQVVVGTPQALALLGSPDCTFRPKRLSINAPTPQFFMINDIKMANVSVNIGAGVIDAFQYNANGVGQSMDLPTLTPANRARISGSYSGFTGGFPVGFDYVVSATFIGPSSLAGGLAT